MFMVTEIQTSVGGTVSTLTWSYADRNSAEEQFHKILTAAAVSALPKHAALMYSEEGFPLRHECYSHTVVPVVEPESVVEE